MFYGDTIEETRALFFSSWQKYLQKQPLTDLEAQLVEVMKAHPEYHVLLANPSQGESRVYHPELGEGNPFLHMGLHLAIREQVATDRPLGIQPIFQTLVKKYTDPLEVEHKMMEQLAQCLWLAQKNNQPPDESSYLIALASL